MVNIDHIELNEQYVRKKTYDNKKEYMILMAEESKKWLSNVGFRTDGTILCIQKTNVEAKEGSDVFDPFTSFFQPENDYMIADFYRCVPFFVNKIQLDLYEKQGKMYQSIFNEEEVDRLTDNRNASVIHIPVTLNDTLPISIRIIDVTDDSV